MVYLTRRQRQVLDFIRRFQERRGYSPSLGEIAAHLGLSAVSTVHEHLSNLQAKGLLRRGWNRSRAIEPVAAGDAFAEDGSAGAPYAGDSDRSGASAPAVSSSSSAEGAALEIPLAGLVAAGSPIEALEVSESVSLPPGFAGRGDAFALRVRGMSMTGDGIIDGDIIVVEKRQRVENGALAVVLVDGTEATVKRFYQRGAVVILRPSNPEMEEIALPAARVEVRGVVVGLLRRYGRV
ncbi:MAG: transcriptional repressor LexA [Candidatus Krumholzibacteria bacterium]|nr:transcriptional repressor LexA [Candidatus Krumholzibacteria bacterium]